MNGAWIVSWYAFDAKWCIKGWSLERRIQFFEKRAIYFAGFGMPVSIIVYLFPGLIATGVWSFLFPPFIITAIYAQPIRLNMNHSPHVIIPKQISLFQFPRFITNYAMLYAVPISKVFIYILKSRPVMMITRFFIGSNPKQSEKEKSSLAEKEKNQ